MPRRPRPLDPSSGPLAEFAAELRGLRDSAGGQARTISWIARKHMVGRSTLYAALQGSRLPTRETLAALVTSWGGDEGEWLRKRSGIEHRLELARLEIDMNPVADRHASPGHEDTMNHDYQPPQIDRSKVRERARHRLAEEHRAIAEEERQATPGAPPVASLKEFMANVPEDWIDREIISERHDELVEQLNNLRVNSGEPSYREISRLIRKKTGRRIAHTTIFNLLCGDTRTWDKIEAYVHTLAPGIDEAGIAEWRHRWMAIKYPY